MSIYIDTISPRSAIESYIDTFEKYRYRYGEVENIDIDIAIDKAILKNIDIGIDIDKAIPKISISISIW